MFSGTCRFYKCKRLKRAVCGWPKVPQLKTLSGHLGIHFGISFAYKSKKYHPTKHQTKKNVENASQRGSQNEAKMELLIIICSIRLRKSSFREL